MRGQFARRTPDPRGRARSSPPSNRRISFLASGGRAPDGRAPRTPSVACHATTVSRGPDHRVPPPRCFELRMCSAAQDCIRVPCLGSLACGVTRPPAARGTWRGLVGRSRIERARECEINACRAPRLPPSQPSLRRARRRGAAEARGHGWLAIASSPGSQSPWAPRARAGPPLLRAVKPSAARIGWLRRCRRRPQAAIMFSSRLLRSTQSEKSRGQAFSRPRICRRGLGGLRRPERGTVADRVVQQSSVLFPAAAVAPFVL